MNTSDTTAKGAEKFDGDKLDKMFAAQKHLMQPYKGISELHYGKIFNQKVNFSDEVWEGSEKNLHTKEGNYLIRDMLNAASQEIGESIQVMKNWKSWKQTEMPTDVNHFKEEIADVVHFLIEAMIFAGIGPDEIFDLYFRKHAVNEFRQESKY